jgi:hypothetical protein
MAVCTQANLTVEIKTPGTLSTPIVLQSGLRREEVFGAEGRRGDIAVREEGRVHGVNQHLF